MENAADAKVCLFKNSENFFKKIRKGALIKTGEVGKRSQRVM